MKITSEKILRHIAIKIKRALKPFQRNKTPQTIVFILGYGRSGTSILINLLAHLFSIDAHGETSKIMQNYLLREDKLLDKINNNKHSIIALKPILNSCMADHFLNDYDNSKVIWLFRDYKDVTYSGLNKFGNRVAEQLKNYIKTGKGDGWIAKTMHREEFSIIREMYYSSYSNNDWMALVWWFVNHTIIREKLTENNNFALIEYNDFVEYPQQYMSYISQFIKAKPNKLHRFIDNKRTGKGRKIVLSNEIEKMCSSLLTELKENKIHENHNKHA
jgi:hypothetical protein